MAGSRLVSAASLKRLPSCAHLYQHRRHYNSEIPSFSGLHLARGSNLAASSPRVYHEDMYEQLLHVYKQGDSVSVARFTQDIQKTGLRLTDPRLKVTWDKLQSCSDSDKVPQTSFIEAVTPNIPLIETALRGKFVIPDFLDFSQKIDSLYQECLDVTGGETADYIPELARMNPHLWGVSLCTVNGQRHSVGDFGQSFTMQSANKCLTYGIAVEEYGADQVHVHIGKEPSGQSFNSLYLNSAGKPHNPMINAGALVLCSLVKPECSITDRTNFVLEEFCKMAGEPSRSVKCDIMTCDSEMETANRNYALLHYLKDMRVLAPEVGIEDTLKFYTRLCSAEVDCERGAVMAATLANTGRCPTTGCQVLSPSTTCHVLSLMHSCGMYDSAGEFSFAVGLPAKSGVSGVIMLVVPGVMGVCLFSPPVNKTGNSVRGLHFCQRLVETFNLHIYDNMMSESNPRWRTNQRMEEDITSLMYAARAGALSSLQRYKMAGINLGLSNYDGRTALHVAAAEGRLKVVEMLLDSPQVSINAKDRWNCTALDEALAFKHHEVTKLLQDKGGVRGQGSRTV